MARNGLQPQSQTEPKRRPRASPLIQWQTLFLVVRPGAPTSVLAPSSFFNTVEPDGSRLPTSRGDTCEGDDSRPTGQ